MLTTPKCEDLLKAGLLNKNGKPKTHPVGYHNLRLIIRGPGIGYWVGVYWVPRSDGGTWSSKSLGPAKSLTLTQAKNAWDSFRAALRNGTAPAPIHKKALQAPTAAPGNPVPTATKNGGQTFGEAIPAFIEEKAAAWRNGATGKTARLYWGDAKNPLLAPLKLAQLTDDVLDAIADQAPTTRAARDTRQRLGLVRDFMRTGKTGDAPKVEHHPSIEWRELPSFYADRLAPDDRPVARAYRLLILTGLRVGEMVRTRHKPGAVWSEIEGDEWVIPGDRMRVVPLTRQMKALLGAPAAPDAPIFPTVNYDSVYRFHDSLQRNVGRDFVPHGFRASFRSWCQHTEQGYEASELCLAHKVGTRASLAYRRSQMLPERRKIMEGYNDFVAPIM